MAPENPFPGPLHDCIKVTEYILENNKKLNLDINKYILAGDSAGLKKRKSFLFFLT
jgi:acetyl esterase/lipase